MEIKPGRFLHIVPIVRIGKFCKGTREELGSFVALGLLRVEERLVNKVFRFDPEA